MKAVFRITKQEKQGMLDKRYLLEKRVLGIFYPLVYINGYQDCLQAICNYCVCSPIYNRAKVIHVGGANSVMECNYGKVALRTLPLVDILSLCPATLLSSIDNLKKYLLYLIVKKS
jgi:hypothetical protein